MGGRATEVSITEVDAYNRRFLCSEALALEHTAIRSLQCAFLLVAKGCPKGSSVSSWTEDA